LLSENAHKGLSYTFVELFDPGMIRVAIVAPSLAVRAGLRSLLDAGDAIQVIEEAAAVEDLASLPSETGVLVLAAGRVEGAELAQALSPAQGAGVLILFEDEPVGTQVLSWLRGRAWGLLPFDSSAEELQAAIRAIHEGLFVGAPVLLEPLLGRLLRADDVPADTQVEALTGREAEVLQLLAQGLANKQIAASLGISEHTVKFHVSAVYAKLGATSRTEAVRMGVRKGLIVL
jgi:DNA-binding NarL/FixJ family response regulator